ncbi:conjugal transfer protein TrbJ [Paraburkholderia sp. HD33-4]|uniref:conjugal transfer protein TrbJ n=1 Tax=Paraburkholderia sp. HD33-4 TaxID=2883242 RepID=UPI001F3B60AC|nr:conjugal transfer protein TrbJ [Paraburkholderia sp. HD33-4]
MHEHRIAATAAVVTILLVPTAHAGGGGVTGGSTEITQLMNHAELAASVGKQAEMVEQNVQAQITRLQQYVTMVQNLKQVPESMISQTIGPYRTQITNYQSLYSAVSQLGQAANATSALFGRSVSEMNATGMSPTQWLTAYTNLAATRGGLYQQQLNQDMGNLGTLAERARNLQEIQSQIPNVTGNVQGLQLLNQQSNVLAGEMVDLHALVQRQVAQQIQDRVAQAQSQASTSALMQARQARAQQLDSAEKSQIQNGQFDLLNDAQ